MALALDSTKCHCLDGLDFGIGNKLQCQGVFATTAPPHPQYGAATLHIGWNRSRDPLLLPSLDSTARLPPAARSQAGAPLLLPPLARTAHLRSLTPRAGAPPSARSHGRRSTHRRCLLCLHASLSFFPRYGKCPPVKVAAPDASLSFFPRSSRCPPVKVAAPDASLSFFPKSGRCLPVKVAAPDASLSFFPRSGRCSYRSVGVVRWRGGGDGSILCTSK